MEQDRETVKQIETEPMDQDGESGKANRDRTYGSRQGVR